MIRRWEARPDHDTIERLLQWGKCVGADGSLVMDDAQAYHVELFELVRIDYFHGSHDYAEFDGKGHGGDLEPIAQTADDEKNDYFGVDLIATSSKSWVVRRVISMQQMWRARIAQNNSPLYEADVAAGTKS
jgi:hypothetical protein